MSIRVSLLRRTSLAALIALIIAALCVFVLSRAVDALPLAASACAGGTSAVAPWPMFHHDAQHTGVSDGVGNVISRTGPTVRWKYQAFKLSDSPTQAEYALYRWFASFPIGDLDGDGKNEVVISTPNGPDTLADRIVALKDDPSLASGVREFWVYTHTATPAQVSATLTITPRGLDNFGPALADVDGDGLLDVIYAAQDGTLRALRGCDGHVLWTAYTGHWIESGPVIADLDGNGTQQVVLATDEPFTQTTSCGGAEFGHCGGVIYVFPLTGTGVISPLWQVNVPWKSDSAHPAVANLDSGAPDRKVIVAGTWGAALLLAWRNANGTIYTRTLSLDAVKLPTDTLDLNKAVIRSAPLVHRFGHDDIVVFGWMPDHDLGGKARLSAVKLDVNMQAGTLISTPLWTIERETWKSGPALLPVGVVPKVVVGYGIGTCSNDPGCGQGSMASCSPLSGGVLAVNVVATDSERIAWERNFNGEEGQIRASAAVADIDGDGQPVVLIPVGCYGKLHAFLGASTSPTGTEEWSFPLGPFTVSSPSLGDLNGDGKLEIVIGSYDGYVWALSGGARTYLPALLR